MSTESPSPSMIKDEFSSSSSLGNPSPGVNPERGILDNVHGLPQLPINLHERKVAITLHWGPIVLISGVVPLVLFFALRHATSLSLKVVLDTFLPLQIVMPLFSLCQRTYMLTKKTSDCRPLGQKSRWGLDYFQWNFIFGFIAVTIIIATGEAVVSLVTVSLPLSVLMLYVCLELLVVQVLMAMRVPAFVRFSSVARGSPLRPGVYVIAEDIVAVDGGLGHAFRQAFYDRYEASAPLRAHLRRLDLLWGSTGVAIVAIIWGCVFGLANKEIGFGLGWGLPWVWAGCMTLWTFHLSKQMLREEKKLVAGVDTEKRSQAL